jgi:hypothetical protein
VSPHPSLVNESSIRDTEPAIIQTQRQLSALGRDCSSRSFQIMYTRKEKKSSMAKLLNSRKPFYSIKPMSVKPPVFTQSNLFIQAGVKSSTVVSTSSFLLLCPAPQPWKIYMT